MSGEILCDECLDTGWLEDREGRVVCSCVGETEPYQQMQAENERLRQLLKAALYHCESEGDDTLVTMINAALRGEGECERLRDLINDMSRAIDCLSAGLPLRDLDEILLRVWKVQGAGE